MTILISLGAYSLAFGAFSVGPPSFADTVPPSAPSTPTASPASASSVNVSWGASTDDSSGVDYYQVVVDGSAAATTVAQSIVVSGFTTETVHTFRIRAFDITGNVSADSGQAVAITLAGVGRPPAAVYARAFGRVGGVVSWNESTGTVLLAQYRVWRSEGSDPFSAIATVAAGGTLSYEDTSAPVWSALRYAVSVVDVRGEGELSAQTAQTSTLATALPSPSGLTAVNTASVLVTWTPLPTVGLTGYHVYRSTTSTSTGTTLTVTPVPTASYHDTSTADYTAYWYRVAAVDGLGSIGDLSPPIYIRTYAGTGTVDAPHGAYSTDTDLCALCHSTHNATAGPGLLKGTTTIDAPLCLSCHDGTSASDVLGEFSDPNRTSRHDVPMGADAGTLSCSNCHGVHSAEQTATVKGLLLAGGTVKSGNAYCYECHGATASVVTRGDLRGFDVAGHGTGIAEPPTGTKVVCLSCHVAHSTVEAGLYPYSGDDRCLGCHSAASPVPAQADIALRLSGSGSDTRHDLLTADGLANGSRLDCANCHEPHTSSATTPCVDPDNPTTIGGMVASDALCLRCHDGELPASVVTSGWAPAPLGAGGTTTTVDLTAAWTSSIHGAGASVSPNLRVDMGWAKGDVLRCDTCHDSHGSLNRFALRDSVSAKTSTLTADALQVVALAGGGADFRFFCSACHVVGPATHPGPLDGGADLSLWPINCIQSGCHTHMGTGL